MLQKQDTARDAALMVAHAVWHVAGALLGGDPKERVLTRSLHDLTPVREMGEGKSGVSSGGWVQISHKPNSRSNVIRGGLPSFLRISRNSVGLLRRRRFLLIRSSGGAFLSTRELISRAAIRNAFAAWSRPLVCLELASPASIRRRIASDRFGLSGWRAAH